MKFMLPATIFFVTYIIRSYKIENGDFVTWDEAHFGKFSEKYLTRSFYFDVHPPLGKMMTALSGYICGQPVGFKFESSTKYPHDFDYAGMRRMHAFVSSFTPVFAYYILKEFSYPLKLRLLLSLIFVFENGFTTIGRLILLDSHLLTFTSAVVYFMTRVYRRRFNTMNMLYLGISLGLVLSIKWIGFFTTGLVGTLIIFRLYRKLNSTCSLRVFVYEFIRNALLLIVIPALIYISLFYIHFKIVNKSSPDEAHMSSFFQASLVGNSHIKNRKYVAYGTKITIKTNEQDNGYLHSHPHVYPGLNENQITIYPHKDGNNGWVLQKVTNTEKEALFIQNNDQVVLYHLETKQYITALDHHSVLSKGYLVGASSEQLSNNNLFRIEIEENTNNEEILKSLNTKFRLYHVKTNTYLKATGLTYPEWGFQQGEVILSSSPNDAFWYVAENTSEKISEDINPVYKEFYRYQFIKNLIEHNILMYTMNKSFVQDENLEPDRIVSKPYEWPLLLRGLRMCSWDDNHMKFYMFGNPFLWYSSTICVVLGPAIFLTKYITAKRNGHRHKKMKMEAFEIFVGLAGWLFHYVPFFFVGRVLYFHHYYPALFFALLLVCYVLKHVCYPSTKWFVLCTVCSYFMFSHLTYGFVDTTVLKKLQLVPTWDFVD